MGLNTQIGKTRSKMQQMGVKLNLLENALVREGGDSKRVTQLIEQIRDQKTQVMSGLRDIERCL